MHSRQAQIVLLLACLVLALFIFIASATYAATARPMTRFAGTWLPLVFYSGTIPFLSLAYTVSHFAALNFNAFPVPPYPKSSAAAQFNTVSEGYDADYGSKTTLFVLGISCLHLLAWFIQSIICTSCELAPILSGAQGNVPGWCPQASWRDVDIPGLTDTTGRLALVKDLLQWAMVALAIGLIDCARREHSRARLYQNESIKAAGSGLDLGGNWLGRTQTVRANDWKSESARKDIELNTVGEPGPTIPTARIDELARPKNMYQQVKFADPIEPQPVGPGAPGNKDNYYGNGMGLQRSNTLNYMYESRVPSASQQSQAQNQNQGQYIEAPKPLPLAPSGSRRPDNYYTNGNEIGLTRSNTNRYESRV